MQNRDPEQLKAMTDLSQTEYPAFMLAPGLEDAGVFGEQSSPGLPVLVANVAFTGQGTARLMVHTMRISSFSTSVSITLRMFPAISPDRCVYNMVSPPDRIPDRFKSCNKS